VYSNKAFSIFYPCFSNSIAGTVFSLCLLLKINVILTEVEENHIFVTLLERIF